MTTLTKISDQLAEMSTDIAVIINNQDLQVQNINKIFLCIHGNGSPGLKQEVATNKEFITTRKTWDKILVSMILTITLAGLAWGINVNINIAKLENALAIDAKTHSTHIIPGG